MTSTDDKPPSIGERYVCAAETSRIEVHADRRTDADYLLAAGFAQSGNVRGQMALRLYRAAEDSRSHITARAERTAIAATVVRMLMAAFVARVVFDRDPPDPMPARYYVVREHLEEEIDTLPLVAREAFDRVHAAIAEIDRPSVTLAKVKQAVDEILVPPEPPRLLPRELIQLHDWSVVTLMARSAGRLRCSHASAIAEKVLRWFLTDVCTSCNARGYDLMPGTQIRSENLCKECNGLGRSPVEKRLKRTHHEAGRWLASEFSSMLSLVLSAMAQRLRQDMDICLDQAPALQARLVDLRSAEAQKD